MQPNVLYAIESRLRTAEFIDVLRRSGLAERRPVDDPARIDAMLRHANLIVTARADGLLVGVARAVTDFSFCCYLSDLAVDKAWQGRGIGRRLMRETRDAASRDIADDGGRPLRCLLLSAPAAMGYYPKAGLARLENAFDFTNL
ncbi:GNAT family N-acetyltransferase [Niveispirillum sp. BGYR6]|uniref:GNAT family N-acetyltransferase n=1 Tax=Niveispirillum sp. BGYR6 TaxID=2971249 RepID=UPI0022B99E66|nr:GNAT family N-acetyltransferase [Niveispirillum sp. BGYR6]MDG5494223.1 GNAT family N-acetyltransferase [Niveispirillum sp. BGYR6]